MSTSTEPTASSSWARRNRSLICFLGCFGAVALGAWLFPRIADRFQASYWGMNAAHYQRFMSRLPRSFQLELESGLSTFDSHRRAKAPALQPDSGRVESGAVVEVDSDQPQSTIRFTTDGSVPTPSSPIWQDDVEIDEPALIRARAFATGLEPSPTVTRSYITALDPSLPVLSLAMDPIHLEDHRVGIIANPFGRGRMWERPALLSIIDPGEERATEGEVHIRVHGNFSRRAPRKKLRLRTSPLSLELQHELRESLGDQAAASDTWVLHHPAGTSELHRQKFGNRLALDMGLIAPPARQCVVFMNGEPWGIYDLMARIDDHLVDQQEQPEDVTLLRGILADPEPAAGKAGEWRDLYQFIEDNDLLDDNAFEIVAKAIDLDNLIDTWVYFVYSADTDRPQMNMEILRADDDEPWQFLIYDTDKGFNYLGEHLEHDTLAWHLRDIPRNDLRTYGTPDNISRVRSTLLFRKLMEREDFRLRFRSRFEAHLDEALSTPRTMALFERLLQEIEPFQELELAGYPHLEPEVADRERQIELGYIRAFLEGRPDFLRTLLAQYFDSD